MVQVDLHLNHNLQEHQEILQLFQRLHLQEVVLDQEILVQLVAQVDLAVVVLLVNQQVEQEIPHPWHLLKEIMVELLKAVEEE